MSDSIKNVNDKYSRKARSESLEEQVVDALLTTLESSISSMGGEFLLHDEDGEEVEVIDVSHRRNGDLILRVRMYDPDEDDYSEKDLKFRVSVKKS